MANHIRCANCRFAQQDKTPSEYTQKRCGKCELRDDCEVCRGCTRRGACKARINPKCKQSCERRLDTLCSQQMLKWPAIQCTNTESEYYRALLNITLGGDKQERITWACCPLGERGCEQ